MSQAFFDGYAGMEIPLPNGRTVKAKVLPLDRAAHYLRLWAKRKDDPEVPYTILAEFPKEVNLVAECNELTTAEFWDVFDSFFDRRVKRDGPTPAPTPAPPSGMTS